MITRLQEMAIFFHNHNMLDRSAARLFLDIWDGEPLSVADFEATGCTMRDIPSEIMMAGDEPTFLGGREKKRPSQGSDIARSHFSAYTRLHPKTQTQAA